MSKLIKRITAIAAAAMMATTMAVSASAEYDCTLQHSDAPSTLDNKSVYGILAAGEKDKTLYGVKIPHNIFAGTFYKGDIDRIYVSLDIVSYPEGELLSRSGRTQPSQYFDGLWGVGVGTIKDFGRVSLFSAHEVYTAKGSAWGEYTALVDVR